MFGWLTTRNRSLGWSCVVCVCVWLVGLCPESRRAKKQNSTTIPLLLLFIQRLISVRVSVWVCV